MARILAVDDEPMILEMMESILCADGHTVDIKTSLPLEDISRANQYDLILLDVMMPGVDGITLCKQLRNQVDCPILFVTAKSEESSIVTGLAAGGDDYIEKPFGAMELRARVAAHLRRENRTHFMRLTFRESSFNLSSKQLTVRNELVPLTKGEYEICEFLARHHGQVFTKGQIVEDVFGFDSESNNNTIATHIKNIRSKLQKVNYMPIKTVWGLGYKWED